MVQFPGRQIQPFRSLYVMPNETSWSCSWEPPQEQQQTGRAAQGGTECSLSCTPAARHGGIWLPVLLFLWFPQSFSALASVTDVQLRSAQHLSSVLFLLGWALLHLHLFSGGKVFFLELPCYGGQTWVLTPRRPGSSTLPDPLQGCHETHPPDSLGLKVIA